MWGWTEREDGLCERNNCSTSRYSYWRTGDKPKPATSTVVFVATRAPYTTEAFYACKTHAAVIKRGQGTGYSGGVEGEVIDSIEPRAETAVRLDTERKARLAEQARAHAEYIEEHRTAKVAEFLTGKGYQPFDVKLDEPDEFGRRHIKVGYERYGLTPNAAERLADELRAAAAEAREALA